MTIGYFEHGGLRLREDPARESCFVLVRSDADMHEHEGTGELLISTLPWSHVFVDGHDTGRDTPVRALRVPEGQHRIGLRTPDGMIHSVDVFVEAGQTVRIIRRY